jgi:hypothetical protein
MKPINQIYNLQELDEWLSTKLERNKNILMSAIYSHHREHQRLTEQYMDRAKKISEKEEAKE